MDWNTFIAVVLGGLIGVATNYFTNRYQLQQWKEDRDEQRREAKIQLKEELMREKIKIIEDFLDSLLKLSVAHRESFRDVSLIYERNNQGLLTSEEAKLEHRALIKNIYAIFDEYN